MLERMSLAKTNGLKCFLLLSTSTSRHNQMKLMRYEKRYIWYRLHQLVLHCTIFLCEWYVICSDKLHHIRNAYIPKMIKLKKMFAASPRLQISAIAIKTRGREGWALNSRKYNIYDIYFFCSESETNHHLRHLSTNITPPSLPRREIDR